LEVIERALNGIILCCPKVFGDERGYFYESYNHVAFSKLIDREIDFVQDNQSMSQKGVLRGLHFQSPPHAQAKLVRVISGSVLDLVVDIRVESPTFGQHYSAHLSAENHHQLFIPEGFAHGFLTLEDDTIFAYKCSDYYNQQSEGSVFWNDSFLAIPWEIENPIVSEKDARACLFKDFKSPF
jgi:dTDP-4-dehydrorhamnose 3,5-epimerase